MIAMFFLLTPLAAATVIAYSMIYMAPRLGLIDRPNRRSSHAKPVPRGGGVAIVGVLLGATALLWPSGSVPQTLGLAIYVGGLPVALVGLIDDRYNLSAGYRLLVHVCASTPAFFLAVGPKGTDLLGGVLGIGALVASINLYNFMDGIDSLAAGEAVFVGWSAGFLLWSQCRPIATLCVVVGSAAAGFLLLNLPPARIFMGDVGSGFLGLTFGLIATSSASQSGIPLSMWVILLSVFLFDSISTLAIRIVTGQKWWHAHREHAYQVAASSIRRHGPVSLFIAAVNVCLLFPLAWLSLNVPRWATVATTLAVLIVTVLLAAARMCFKDEKTATGARG